MLQTVREFGVAVAALCSVLFGKDSGEPWTVVLETGTVKSFPTADEADRFAIYRQMHGATRLRRTINVHDRTILLSESI